MAGVYTEINGEEKLVGRGSGPIMHPKMFRRILTVASEKLTSDERYGFFVYFEELKARNAKAPQDKKRTPEELLLEVLSVYLPERWQNITLYGKHGG